MNDKDIKEIPIEKSVFFIEYFLNILLYNNLKYNLF